MSIKVQLKTDVKQNLDSQALNMGHICSLNCQTPGIHILFSRIRYSVIRFLAAGTRQLSMLLSLSTEYGSSAGVGKALPRASYISI